MPVITRSQAKTRQPIVMHSPPGASHPGWTSALSSELPQQTSFEGGVNCNDKAFGGCPSTLAVGNERPLAVRTCRTDCLTRPVPVRENQFVSNTTGIN